MPSGSIEEEQRYFTDVLLAIKQVMGAYLQEMQDKFQNRFEKLEDDVKSRDETISKLKARIVELEKAQEDSLTVCCVFFSKPFFLSFIWSV